MSRITAALCASLLLAGCVSTGGTRFPRHYALDASTPAMTQARHPVRSGQGILKVARIDVPSWLAGTGMYYRLTYRDGNRLATYARSDWVAPPATLLEPLLRHAIAATGGWHAVVGPGTPANADASVHIQLENFSQTFATPNQSTGILDATATLVGHPDERVTAQKHFHIEIPAPTADAQGGARALATASHQFAAQLGRWLQAKGG